MTRVSPTAEGFRAAFHRPSLTFAEIAWRWTVGGVATALFFFGLFQYLGSLPVTSGELLFLRTRQPYLVAEAIAHIFRGTLSRVAVAGIVAAFLLAALWIIAGSLGRSATGRALLEYFRRDVTRYVPSGGAESAGERGAASAVSSTGSRPFAALIRLNFLRVAVALAAVVGIAGAGILAGFASPAADPQAGLAHVVAFVGASVIASMPLGLAGALPWRLVLVGTILVTLVYFTLADWFYIARLAGYVCIAEMPLRVLAPVGEAPQPYVPPSSAPGPPVQTTIDREEPILSDVPNLPILFVAT